MDESVAVKDLWLWHLRHFFWGACVSGSERFMTSCHVRDCLRVGTDEIITKLGRHLNCVNENNKNVLMGRQLRHTNRRTVKVYE